MYLISLWHILVLILILVYSIWLIQHCALPYRVYSKKKRRRSSLHTGDVSTSHHRDGNKNTIYARYDWKQSQTLTEPMSTTIHQFMHVALRQRFVTYWTSDMNRRTFYENVERMCTENTRRPLWCSAMRDCCRRNGILCVRSTRSGVHVAVTQRGYFSTRNGFQLNEWHTKAHEVEKLFSATMIYELTSATTNRPCV